MRRPLPTTYVNEDEMVVPLPSKPTQTVAFGSERETVLEAQVRALLDTNAKLLKKLNWWRNGSGKLLQQMQMLATEASEPATEKKVNVAKKKVAKRRPKR